jgi:hypothetical protein
MDIASLLNAVPAGAGGAPLPDPAGAPGMEEALGLAEPSLPPEMAGMDPMMGAPEMGVPMMGPAGPEAMLPSGALPPMAPPQGQGPMYPTADPGFMASLLMSVSAQQQQDHEQLSAQQQQALTGNPVFEALMSGSPMGPGAGQDGAALGAPTGVLEPPMGV